MRPAMPKRRRLLALTLAMGVAVSMAAAGAGPSVAVAQAPVGDGLALTAAGPDEVDPPAEEDAEERPDQGESEGGDPTDPGEDEATDPAEPDAEEETPTPQAEESTPDAEPTPEESAGPEMLEEDATDAVSVVPDPMLVEAINRQLERPLDTPITVEDLQGLEALQIGDVSSLEGLQHATSLQRFTAHGNPDLEDLTPLAGLPLEYFDVMQTGIRSVKALAGAPLTTFHVHSSPLQSLEGLGGPVRIENIYLGDTLVTDLSPLQNVPVGHLIISTWSHEQQLLDFSPLSGTTRSINVAIYDVGTVHAWSPVNSTTTKVAASNLPKSPDGTSFQLNEEGAWPYVDVVEIDLTAHPKMTFDWQGESSESTLGGASLYGNVTPRLWHQDPEVASAQQGFVGSAMQVQLRVRDAEAPPAAGLTINGPDDGPVVTWSVVGELPEGLTLSRDGVISGTPASVTEGPVEVEVVATDAEGNASPRTYTFEVLEALEVDPELGGGETPGGETPGGETPGGETPGGETPGGETPGGEQPGDQPGDQPGPGGAPDGATPSPGQGPDSAAKAVDAGWLPNTGGPAWWLTLAGLGTALAGGAVTWWARRRRLS